MDDNCDMYVYLSETQKCIIAVFNVSISDLVVGVNHLGFSAVSGLSGQRTVYNTVILPDGKILVFVLSHISVLLVLVVRSGSKPGRAN